MPFIPIDQDITGVHHSYCSAAAAAGSAGPANSALRTASAAVIVPVTLPLNSLLIRDPNCSARLGNADACSSPRLAAVCLWGVAVGLLNILHTRQRIRTQLAMSLQHSTQQQSPANSRHTHSPDEEASCRQHRLQEKSWL